MTMDDSMDGAAFAVFIEQFLCPHLWQGAVVVMDNLPAHKLTQLYQWLKLSVRVLFVYPPTLPILILLKCGGHSLNRFCEVLLPRPQQWLIG